MELQREIAILEEQLRTTQKSIEEKLAQLTAQSQQATQAAEKTNDAVGGLGRRLDEQAKNLTVPVANIGSKVDQRKVSIGS